MSEYEHHMSELQFPMLEERLSRAVERNRSATDMDFKASTHLASSLIDDGLVCEDYGCVPSLHVYPYIIACSPRSPMDS